jgi:hypothetical protein
MPRGPRGIARYAPAEPFIVVIDEWIDAHNRRRKAQPYAWMHPIHTTERRHGIRVLAEQHSINRDWLMKLMHGEKELVTLEQADKIALAIDVPLVLLAEEFLPWAQAQKKWCRKVAA